MTLENVNNMQNQNICNNFHYLSDSSIKIKIMLITHPTVIPIP